jgi:hypothetical protein
MHPLLVMAIMQAASMGANYAGQRKIDKGRAEAMRQSQARNEELARKGEASSRSTTDLLIGTSAKEKAAADERFAAVEAARNQVNPLTNQTTDQLTASTLAPISAGMTQDIADSDKRTAAFTNQQAKAKAALGSFGDVTMANNIGVNRNQQNLNQNSASMQNWNQFVLPAQMEAANQSGRGFQTLGDLIQMASMIYGGVGLAKGAATASAATGADAAWNSPHLFEATKAAAPNFLPQAGAAVSGAAYDSPELLNTVLTRNRNPYLLSGNSLFDAYR